MIVGFAYDLRMDPPPGAKEPEDFDAEFDAPETIDIIARAIEKSGHQVVRIGNVGQLLKRLDTLKDEVDLVFNITEGMGGRNRESQVPMLLEYQGIPYVGADALSLGLSLDKVLAKQVFQAEGIPTPRSFQIRDVEKLTDLPIPLPLFVKPRHEGSSKSLTEKSRVRTFQELKEQADWIIKTYRQPALVEEFISGMEFTVAVIGNDPPEALAPIQIQIDGENDLGDRFYTFGHISSTALKYLCPAQIPKALEEKIKALAVRAYRAIDCRDFGRVDFRVDKRGKPWVLEVNPLPSLSMEDVFEIVAKHMKLSFDEMIGKILDVAIEREGLRECVESR